MAKLTLDLHDIYNHSGQIEKELNRIVQEAIAKRIALVEIIPGKGSGQLKKHVLRFLTFPITDADDATHEQVFDEGFVH